MDPKDESLVTNGHAQVDYEHTNDDDSVEAHLKHATIVEAPDGGYGWIVLIAGFFCNVIVDGIIFAAPATLRMAF